MGLDKLGILFIIIILPISLVLNSYTNAQMETLRLQADYDRKLDNATYELVKTYQYNTINEDFSNLGNVRINAMDSSINVFFNALAANFNLTGYNRKFLEDYVPAIVFTTYDGYYIYSKYTNTLGDEDYCTQDEIVPGYEKIYPSTYYGEHKEDGKDVSQQLYGLKPFIHYSCRYKIDNDNDFVITYSLDNYITIEGIVDGNWVYKAGYLVDITEDSETKILGPNKVSYRGISIGDQSNILSENLILEPEDGSAAETKSYKYHKINGVKYYYDDEFNGGDGKWFSVANGKKLKTLYNFEEYGGTTKDNSAFRYYKEAIEFTTWVQEKLSNLETRHAEVDSGITKNGNRIFSLKGIEEPGSNFNEHRLEVIRYSIEKNLSIAIANYNHFGNTTTNFQMPEFNEVEWDKIQKNLSVITYLQGMPIGGKIYNGVSVVSNDVNEETVTENSIVLVDGRTAFSNDENHNYYYVTKKDWNNVFPYGQDIVGVYNVDLQKREVEYNKTKYYYYPKLYYSTDKTKDVVDLYADKKDTLNYKYNYNGNIYKYLEELKGKNFTLTKGGTIKGDKLILYYYSALGRERYGMYKQQRNYQDYLKEITP